jgi:hypothetical protein
LTGGKEAVKEVQRLREGDRGRLMAIFALNQYARKSAEI